MVYPNYLFLELLDERREGVSETCECSFAVHGLRQPYEIGGSLFDYLCLVRRCLRSLTNCTVLLYRNIANLLQYLEQN
jgi:hypothetical protein